jgi:hypothetical protein
MVACAWLAGCDPALQILRLLCANVFIFNAIK